MRRIPTALFTLAVVWGLLALTAFPASAEAERLSISASLGVHLQNGRELALEVDPSAYRDDAHVASRLLAANQRVDPAWRVQTTHAETGEPEERIRIPLRSLGDEMRSLVLRTMFPEDRHVEGAWLHVVRRGRLPTFGEGLWQVAEWFVGEGSSFTELMTANGLSSPELRAGQEIRIPHTQLHVAFQPRLTSDDGLLEFGADDGGPYGGYRLRSGEALYSAVVQRFSGRTDSEDVNTLSSLLCERSGIDDLRDIPVGFLVKIPLDYLEPQFLPASHPRRKEAERLARELEAELAAHPPTETPRGLSDVVVILDPGHGGRDLGTMNNGIWEHDYVYDVTCRLKKMLETRTSARIEMTLIDEKTGCVPSRRDKLVANQQGTIQTNPPYMAKERGEARIAVNLRWYLANSIYRREIAKGTDPDKIIFVSIHADARHASLSGVMVYVPGSAYRTRSYGQSAPVYTKRAEVKEKPTIRFSKSDRIRSEAVSRKFADEVVNAFRKNGLPVHAHEPVRHRIIRGKQRYVPAVLRGNSVPHKVLVEMVNLSNKKDARILASAKKRQTLATALYDALLGYYGDSALRAQATRTSAP
ncbi:MAG: N-acetylmuramoyl-L-alanine amidase [Acidobacteriota bacterium]|nr:N-acetylmuramoyl-L-alanine amidase [Acidobacteriota bacterium]MDH3784006.1 N-acetylmuramoyl-L-alanine amidase [Acidobacteriota bacterium]